MGQARQRYSWSKDSCGSRGHNNHCTSTGHGTGRCQRERTSNQQFDQDTEYFDQNRNRNHRQECEKDHSRDQHSDDFDQTNGSCIWLGGCPNDITEREIERLCSKHGPVHKITIKHSARDTFVFVQYGQPSHAKEAIRGLDQVMAFGAGIIKVAPANKKGCNKREDGVDNHHESEHDQGCKRNQVWEHQRHRPVRVYLSQLPRDMEEDELQEIAAEYGKVLQYELHREGAYKCGWVEYASKREAEEAVNELDDRRMNEWTMRLQAYMYPGGEP